MLFILLFLFLFYLLLLLLPFNGLTKYKTTYSIGKKTVLYL